MVRVSRLAVRFEFIHNLTAFAPFAPSTASNPRSFDTLLVQKIVFILCNCLSILVGAWKCHQMGLLPVGTGDWLAFEPRGQVGSIFLLLCRPF